MTSTPATEPKLRFRQFLEGLPDEDGFYELVDGNILRKRETRHHDTIADWIGDLLKTESKRLNLNNWISGRVVIKTTKKDGTEQGRHPDITVVDQDVWKAEPNSYSALIEPPKMVVEVVSTNWEDDYVDKLEEYQRLKIPEYWIVDYLAVASRSYLGNPKQPTIFVYCLDENGVYQMNAYREGDRIISPTFPEMKTTVSEIFES
jgi:Uma2 family endonuclease